MNEPHDELLVAEQRRELMEAANLEADLDFAFELQVQEALVASLALQPSSSHSSPPPPSPIISKLTATPTTPSVTLLQTLELDKFQQELQDRKQSETEMMRVKEEIKRRAHDEMFALEIDQISDDEWNEVGDDIERPFGEGSSKGDLVKEPFRLYFKGLFNDPVSGIGVALCDPRGNLILKIQKAVGDEWKNVREVELLALIEGLNGAVSLDIRRIDVYCVNVTIFKQISRRWTVKQQRIAKLINQVFHLETKFDFFHSFLVPGKDLKFAFELARGAIDSQVTRSVSSSSSVSSSNAKNVNETCSICLEDTEASQMFVIMGCLHRYCFSCMKQHMKVKILQGMVPGCPHEGCKTTLSLDGTGKLLTPKLIDSMSQLIKEASVPVTEKVYCPYPKCSTLMSKAEALEYTNKMDGKKPVMRRCVKCHLLFCIECKVPWHSNMNCYQFKRSNLATRMEETKLKSLANQNLWRQCVKCNHMIELAEGCYHMTCRCGYEFCYTCGAEWRNKKPTCSCKLWDERNIMDDYDEDEDEDFDDDDEFDDDEFIDQRHIRIFRPF